MSTTTTSSAGPRHRAERVGPNHAHVTAVGIPQQTTPNGGPLTEVWIGLLPRESLDTLTFQIPRAQAERLRDALTEQLAHGVEPEPNVIPVVNGVAAFRLNHKDEPEPEPVTFAVGDTVRVVEGAMRHATGASNSLVKSSLDPNLTHQVTVIDEDGDLYIEDGDDWVTPSYARLVSKAVRP